MKSFHRFILFLVLTVMLLWGYPQGQAKAGEGCRDLIQNKCASCHFVKHICPKIKQKQGTLAWKWTVNAMVKEGMTASDEEQHQLVNCLVDPDEQVKAFCPAQQ